VVEYELLAGLGDVDRRAVLAPASRRRSKRGEVVFDEGAAAGDVATIAVLGPGEHFGEIGLLRDVPRTATVTAVEPTSILCLERDDFLDVVSQEAEARSVLDDLVLRRMGR
jgi:CRP-like cAMP-binding protein